jgi:hypothetical protein
MRTVNVGSKSFCFGRLFLINNHQWDQLFKDVLLSYRYIMGNYLQVRKKMEVNYMADNRSFRLIQNPVIKIDMSSMCHPKLQLIVTMELAWQGSLMNII